MKNKIMYSLARYIEMLESKINERESIIDSLSEQLYDKDEQIDALNEDKINLEYHIAELEYELEELKK